MSNLLEESVNKGIFNENVHQQDELGDPIRNDDGSIRRKTNWKATAVDRQGRTYNPHVHGELTLDEAGYLKVKRRGESAPVGQTNRTEAFVAKHKENGYAYYVMNDEGGRMEQFLAADWEPVTTESGPARMKVGQARGPNTEAILMRKPIEWYEADQKAKIERNKLRFKQSTSPKEDDGQYSATESSPLR